MRTIIAGSRSIFPYEPVLRAMAEINWLPTEIISGHAPGVDRMGERWARENNVPLRIMLADWEKHGKIAGFIRNRQMAEVADALVAIWDGKSRGTEQMLDEARAKGLKIHLRDLSKRVDRSIPIDQARDWGGRSQIKW